MEQLVARQAHNLKVSGSSPLPATIYKALEMNYFQGFFYGNLLGLETLDRLILQILCGKPR